MDAAKVAFIGGGNMAAALIGGLLKAGRSADAIGVVEPSAERRAQLAAQFGIGAQAAAGPALQDAGLVVWAVKPQAFDEAAAACAPHVGTALQLSVMAGIRSDAIAVAVGSQRVVRAMPNTPALVGRGIAGLYARPAVAAAEREMLQALLAPTGAVLWVEHEVDLDAVTALSGSGPAYVFYVLEALVDAGVALGLTAAQSRTLAQATFDGATALASASPLALDALRAQVTSKGGTTAAAVDVLDAREVRAAFGAAVAAAARRARELGGGPGG